MFEGPGKSSAPRALSTENAHKDETQTHAFLRVSFFSRSGDLQSPSSKSQAAPPPQYLAGDFKSPLLDA
jgi:hypothetical protein